MNNDDSFDQQQTFIEQNRSQMQQSVSASHLSVINGPTSVLVDNISNRISSIEERLNACDSIYRLATQTNTVREKDRREKFYSLISYLQTLDQRISNIEEKVDSIPQQVKQCVREEIKQFDNAEQIENMINTAQTKLTERISMIEKQHINNLKKSQKELKRIKIDAQLARSSPDDDDKTDEVAAQISEMKRRQTLMFDLLHAMRSHNSQDYDKVNNNLSTLWAQLSIKRADSPKKH